MFFLDPDGAVIPSIHPEILRTTPQLQHPLPLHTPPLPSPSPLHLTMTLRTTDEFRHQNPRIPHMMRKQHPLLLHARLHEPELNIPEARGCVGKVGAGIAVEGAHVVGEEESDRVGVDL